MKASTLICTLLSVPAVLASAVCAQDVKTNIKDYLPCDGTVRQGAVVQIARDASFNELQKAMVTRLAALPKEKQEAIVKNHSADVLMDYNADLWPDKAEYDRYAEAWKKSRLVPMTEVALGLVDNGDNTYSVLSATRVSENGTMPLTIGSLQYDAGKNVWVSNNGELKPTAFTAGENHVFGAQTGTEWTMEREDSLSWLKEVLRITKTKNGKAVFVSYAMNEVSTISGTIIANHGYTIYLPIQTIGANATKPGRR